GTVRRGRFAGARLAELKEEELVALWRECRAEDEASASLLEAYLDRAFPRWREASGPGASRDGGRREQSAPRHTGAMTRDEALKVLGLASGAGPAEIKAAHRRLIAKLHPDHGGSDWLAARINQAKDVLLSK